MIAGRQEACAHNNALWCDAVLKTAGARTRFRPGFWQAEDRILPLYPGLVTLSAQPGTDFYTALESLPPNAAVKDSFASLNLGPLGFQKLFSGTWLFRPAQSATRPPHGAGWHKVTHVDGLKKWLAAWNADEELHHILSAKLLDMNAVDFAAIYKEDGIRAGAIFNAGPKLGPSEVLGLSNVFSRKNWLYAGLHDLLEPFPHRQICTYETDDGLLPVYRQLGFEDCGRLGVWLKVEPQKPATDA
ncbi:hypothetical protein [Roseibium sp.]|uniref:hypothetical protein n=1 Tax=Roseibium sp. TaxID=1936156 RepID=UPI003D098A88